MKFEHVRLDSTPPCGRLGFCLTPDLTGNDRPDILIGGMGAEGRIDLLGRSVKMRQLPFGERYFRFRESNVFWYENPGWKRHDVVTAPDLCVGASCGDIDGDGRPELVVGENMGSRLFWFDPPEDPRASWTQRLITDRFQKYHDTLLADVDADGEDELVILSQQSGVVCYYDIPDDPRVAPWPDSHLHVVADNLVVEGVAVTDLDRDGHPELIAGPNVFFKNGAPDRWDRHELEGDWEWTRVAVGDLTGNGREEIVLTEGDLPYHGDRRGRLGVVDTDTWRVNVLDDGLYNPHTVQLADMTGDGRVDIVVGEMDSGDYQMPRLLLYRNEGDGFVREEIHTGVGTHEAKVIDIDGSGRLDIVGKSYGPRPHVDLWTQVA